MNDYPFTVDDFRFALEGSGRKVKRAGKGLLTQCLVHMERHPSASVFFDGWMQCYSCGQRYHISNYFDELRDPAFIPTKPAYFPKVTKMPKPVPVGDGEKTQEYTRYDLYPEWADLPLIPRDHQFKTIPLEVLDNLGWRWTDGIFGMGAGYLIPYFNASKTAIPFAQVRHLTGSRRFTMLPGAEILTYGKWNLHPGERLFLVEGTSDCATLDYAAIPWIGVPSASCGVIVGKLARYCLKSGIGLIYAGDNDEAGDNLKAAMDEVAPYRLKQPPKKYKDWGDFLVAEGVDRVHDYCWEELTVPDEPPLVALASDMFSVPRVNETLC